MLCFVVLVALAQANELPAPPSLSGDPTEVIATLGNEVITRSEWSDEVNKRPRQDVIETLYELCERKLIRQKAKSEGMKVTDDELSGHILKVEDRRGGASALDAWLERQGRTREVYLEQTRDDLLLQRLLLSRPDLKRDLDPTPREIRTFYNLYRRRYPFTQPAEVKLGLLFIPKGDKPAVALDLAKQLHERAASGSATLEALASEKADLSYRENGYELSKPGLADSLKVFVLSSPKVGSLSEPLSMGSLYVLARLIEISKEEVWPFEDAMTQDYIAGMLFEQRIKDMRRQYVRSIAKSYYIQPPDLFGG